jgi:hypothetical protein
VQKFSQKAFDFSLSYPDGQPIIVLSGGGRKLAAKTGQIGALVRTLGAQLRDALSGSGRPGAEDRQNPTARSLVVAKVSRNAVAELVNQARNHPQKGSLSSANPAYVALAELTEMVGRPGLALGLRSETGEIGFLDLEMDPEEAASKGGAFLERRQNRNLWRQLKHLSALKVDRTMLSPARPIRSPEDMEVTEDTVEEDEDS